MNCFYCGREVIYVGTKAKGFDTDYTHSNHIRRCRPEESGQAYGLEADVQE